jgi:hypothetical protein
MATALLALDADLGQVCCTIIRLLTTSILYRLRRLKRLGLDELPKPETPTPLVA